MSDEDEDFGALVATLDPPMAVVTTVSGGERAGCLIGFHAQCSIAPRRYAIWLSKANHTFRVALHAQHFAVHFLGREQVALAELFGTVSGDRADKFDRCDWTPGDGGVPVLDGCDQLFLGTRAALLDEGSDHVCIVLTAGAVRQGASFRPLRLSDVAHLQPGHESEERPRPASERTG